MGRRSVWRGFCAAILSLAGAGAAVLVVACITPPPEWANPPPTAPRILDDQVQPPIDQLLQSLPQTFTVPVSVEDPQENFSYAIFVDYDPLNNPQPVDGGGVAPATAVTFISFAPPPQLTPQACHRLDFLVVHDFARLTNGDILLHTPDSVGGDQVTWFYLPGGSPTGCPIYDAGLSADAAPSDGAPDGLPTGTP